MYYDGEIRRKREMKRLLCALMCLCLAVGLAGCSSSLENTYPKVKSDFEQSDYAQLEKLSTIINLIMRNYVIALFRVI